MDRAKKNYFLYIIFYELRIHFFTNGKTFSSSLQYELAPNKEKKEEKNPPPENVMIRLLNYKGI